MITVYDTCNNIILIIIIIMCGHTSGQKCDTKVSAKKLKYNNFTQRMWNAKDKGKVPLQA
jgi:hypothetical protein